MNPKISIVVVDSRSKTNPEWVETCIQSIKNQTYDNIELVLVPNTDHKLSIGAGFNLGVKNSSSDWVMFVGDDDWLAADFVETLVNVTKRVSVQSPAYSTYMTAVNDTKNAPLERPFTGLYRKEYLLKYPFSEEISIGIDREYLDKIALRGDSLIVIPYYFGYFYRQHDHSTSGIVHINKPLPKYYFNAKYPTFIDPFADRLIAKETREGEVHVDTEPFNPQLVKEAEVIWCDWGDENAVRISRFETDAKKILRIHAYEAYSQFAPYINYNGFDHVLFVSPHIQSYLEQRLGFKFMNASLMPNGVDMNKFTLSPDKVANNNVAYVGRLSNKKGIQLLIQAALKNPAMQFHVAGKFDAEDTCEYFHYVKPDNMTLHSFRYDLNDWLKDKTYIINTSPRESLCMALLEGMAAGLKPLVHSWIGSYLHYPPENIWRNLEDLSGMFHLSNHSPEYYRKYVEENYNFEDAYQTFERLIGQKEN